MIFLKLLEPIGNDFVVYWESAKMLLTHQNPYVGLITRTFPLNYPPTASLFLLPWGLLNFNTANILWNILSLLALIVTILLVAKKHRLFYIFIFTIPFFPEKFNFGMGQINNFVLLFSVLGITSPFFLAFATGIKIAPAIIVFYYLLTHDGIKIKKFVIYLIFLSLLSLIFVPWQWQSIYFSKVLPLSFTESAKDWYYNQSLYGFLARTFNTTFITQVLFYLGSSAILFITYLRSKKLSKQNILSAVFCLYLLIHPMAIQHYFMFAIVPLILLGINRYTILAYLLVAVDIKDFDGISRNANWFLSHDFYGILILWIVSLNLTKYLPYLWAILITIIYLLSLACKGGFCFYYF